MRNLIYIVLLSCFVVACKSSKKGTQNTKTDEINITKNDTVRISSDKTEYEIIIIDPGFNAWLLSRARPEGYYSQTFLENRNYQLVLAWNQRVNQPFQYDPNLQ